MNPQRPSKSQRATRRQTGVAAIEFALVLPVFLMLALGAMDYGYYWLVDNLTNNAAREGARAATTIAGTCASAGAALAKTEAEKVARQTMAIGGFDKFAAVNVICTSGAPLGDPTWNVEVTADFPKLVGFVPMPNSPTAGNTRTRAVAVFRGTP